MGNPRLPGVRFLGRAIRWAIPLPPNQTGCDVMTRNVKQLALKVNRIFVAKALNDRKSRYVEGPCLAGFAIPPLYMASIGCATH
jgi:hypothetical protein